MATFVGEVRVVNGKSKKSKKTGKPYTLWSLKLTLESGDESPWIDCGFEKPELEKGEYVQVETEQNDRGYEVLKSFEAHERPAPKAAPKAAATQDEGGADRHTQIVLQHSQEMAIAEAALLIANGALPLSAANSKSGVVKRYAEITQAIEKLTVQRYFDVVTARLLDSVQDAGDVDVTADGAIPAAQSDSTATDTSEDD